MAKSVVRGICPLCKEEAELKKSHIVPDLFGRWIKKTSATGRLRDSEEPDVRREDIHWKHMLCDDCEKRLSKYEGRFADNVFYPYVDGKEVDLQKARKLEEGWFENFLISLAFKVLVDRIDIKDHEPLFAPHVDSALEQWRKYILGESENWGTPSPGIILMGRDIEELDLSESDHPKILWYYYRSVEHTIICNDDWMIIYVKVPFMIITVPIYISKAIAPERSLLIQADVMQFARSRPWVAFAKSISQRQLEIMNMDILKDMDKFNKSQTKRIVDVSKIKRKQNR